MQIINIKRDKTRLAHNIIHPSSIIQHMKQFINCSLGFLKNYRK